MKKFIALAALVLMSMVTTTVYAQESNAQTPCRPQSPKETQSAHA